MGDLSYHMSTSLYVSNYAIMLENLSPYQPHIIQFE